MLSTRTLLFLALACAALRGATGERLPRTDGRRLLTPATKVQVCHWDDASNRYQLISVAPQAWVRCSRQ